jgi:hypothetical protein
MTGDGGSTVPAGPWLTNPWVAGMGDVRVWVRSKVPVGYLCGVQIPTEKLDFLCI